jgi:hypothetical protein
MIFQVGDLARLRASFKNVDGAQADPTSVSLVVMAPDETIVTYTTGIVRSGIGTYYFDLAVTQSGGDNEYKYRWVATGAVEAVEESFITVAPTILTPAVTTSTDISINEYRDMRNTTIRAMGDPTLSGRMSDGRYIIYRSMEELKAALGVLEDRILELSSQSTSRVAVAQFRRD